MANATIICTKRVNCGNTLCAWSRKHHSDRLLVNRSSKRFTEHSFQFSTGKEQLNSYDVYELSPIETPGMRPTLRLLINDTAVNNQTNIQCFYDAVFITKLYVLNPVIPLTGDIINMGVNLSWSGESQSLIDDPLRFSLRICSNGSSSYEISLDNRFYYYFTAPEGVPPCELYNFSITATYVGATYTGTDCSVLSPVFSTKLPSLPNISRLDSSLDYVLTKQATGFTLYISFEPASYCNDYPIMNYTLEINGTRNEDIRVSVFAPNAENFTVGEDLSENITYSFRIQVANTVGVVSTSDRHFYTTDVQVVTATLIEGVNTSIIQCEFIEDSNAAGCRIVLTTNNGEQDYYNLTKNQNTNLTAIAVTLELPPSCYSGVKAFDLESDGSIGTLAIPGHIMSLSQVQCTPATLPVKPSSSETLSEAWIIALVVMISAVVVSILSAVIIVIVGVCKSMKSHETVHNIARDAPTNTSLKTRCQSMSQCSADETAQVELRERVDSRNESINEKHLPDQLDHYSGKSITSAKGEMEATCNDMPTNCQPEESAASVNFYSEIASISKPRENATPGGGSGKSENVYSEPGCEQPPTKGEKTRVPLEEALYDQPVAGLERTPGDGADYSRTSYCQQTSPVLVNGLSTANSEGAQYATLDQNKDHIYFTLEPDEPPRGVIPSPTSHLIPFIPNTQVPPPPATISASPPPIYQEISELSTSRGGSANRSITCTANGGSIPNTPLSSSSLPHVQRSLSAPMADQGVTDISNQWVKTNNINVERGTMV